MEVQVTGGVDSLDWNSSNQLVVAVSRLTGRIWNGELIVYEYAQNQLKEIKKYSTNAGNTHVIWYGDKKSTFVASSDDGGLHFWALNRKDKPIRSLVEHDDIVTSVSENKVDKDVFVSSSFDMRF